MRSFWVRLLTLIAVLLMPVGMAAPATAAHATAQMSMPMQHCPDQRQGHDLKGGFAECTMACAAALPAADLPRPAVPIIHCAPTPQLAAERLHGLHPETATPPPRRS